MKTANLGIFIRDELSQFTEHDSQLVSSLSAAVAEDMRVACEDAWADGHFHGFDDAMMRSITKNPYSKPEVKR